MARAARADCNCTAGWNERSDVDARRGSNYLEERSIARSATELGSVSSAGGAMQVGLYSASTALNAFQTTFETTANNLANTNTTGFKRSLVDFQDLFPSGENPLQMGHGVRVADISTRDFAQGAERATGQELDLAISGNGFFAVQAADGTLRYTRDGHFERDGLGRLVTGTGEIVQPPLTFPPDTVSISINQDGLVSAVTGSGQPVSVGQLTLTTFPNPVGLSAEGNNLFRQTSASGEPMSGLPGRMGVGVVRQRALEQSNVDLATEMTSLVSAQRAYDANARVIKSTDQLIESSLQLIR